MRTGCRGGRERAGFIGRGTVHALPGRMVVHDFRELQCWQLANALRAEVIAICDNEPVARHLRFCSSFTEAAASVCRNIAEGFARFGSAEIVQFFGYALASLDETRDHLEECRVRRFISEADHQRLSTLAAQARGKIMTFRQYHITKARRPRRT